MEHFKDKLKSTIDDKNRRTDKNLGKFVYYCVTGIVCIRKSNERVCFCNFESSFKADLELLFALFSKEKLFDVNNNRTKKLFKTFFIVISSYFSNSHDAYKLSLI